MSKKINKNDLTLDSSWFDSNPDKYLSRDDFKRFQETVGIDLCDLVSDNVQMVKKAQTKIAHQCLILNEVQKRHYGFMFPLFVYTNCADFCEPIPALNIEADKVLLSTDMCDSLRRRHIALSHVLIPNLIDELYEHFKEPLIIKNLGSGVGLDVLNAAINSNGKIKNILNYEIDDTAVSIGTRLLGYAESKKLIKKNKIKFINKSLTESNEKCHLAIQVGIICGLSDREAKILLLRANKSIIPGGKILVTSSNHNMRSNDPLASFVIQKMGTRKDPRKGWALNCRDEESILSVLSGAKFNDVKLYTDGNYTGMQNLPTEILFGIDYFAGQAFGYDHPRQPLSLPKNEILQQKTGYNWLAIGTKGTNFHNIP
ncbi:hypothetical protein JW935_10705 [candidate division KSB1 bacterium]|nr:hypothetical protein [candidate division KSB1 bacterium]